MENCSKCKVNKKHGSTGYCYSCYAEYMKEYRLKKRLAMEKPVLGMDKQVKVMMDAVGEEVLGLVSKPESKPVEQSIVTKEDSRTVIVVNKNDPLKWSHVPDGVWKEPVVKREWIDMTPRPSPVYWSFYCTHGSEIWKQMKEEEAKLTV